MQNKISKKDDLLEAKKLCVLNGFMLHEAANEILFIKTKFSNWRVEPYFNKYKLFHKNSLDFKAIYNPIRRSKAKVNHFSGDYHLQKQFVSITDAIDYIYRHDRYAIELKHSYAN